LASNTKLDSARKCPHNPTKFHVIYDGGTTPDLPVLLCESCFETKSLFQKFVKHKELVQENTEKLEHWEV